MGQSIQIDKEAQFTIQNIGGITQTAVEVSPGVTVLSGNNATNRTSLLQAIMVTMGSTNASIKADADTGQAQLTLADETYRRTLQRSEGGIKFSGEGYLDDPSVAELFAFLLESNEARRAVARGEGLHELIMRPVDVDAIKTEIERLESEKADINDTLATIDSRKTELPKLEQRRTDIQSRIEHKREELADLEADIDDHNRGVTETRQKQQESESKLDELRSTRSELESVRRNLQNQQESITSLKQERSELEQRLQDLPGAPMADGSEMKAEITRLRERRQTLNAEISDLQSLIQYNEERLNEEDYPIIEDSEGQTQAVVTDQLLTDADEEVVCWTCGSTVERAQIEETIERLQELRSQKLSTLSEIKSRLAEAKAELGDVKKQQRQREELETEIADIEDELGRRQSRVETLKYSRQELTETIESLESAVDELKTDDFDEVLDLHKQANQIEFELERLESDLEDVTEEIEQIETRLESAEDLRDRRSEIIDILTRKRTKIKRIEQEAVDQFNEHMDTVLNVLGYDNLDRIWVERVQRTVREGREKIKKTTFELHVVRTTESGTAYEDTVDHLSESEREVTGLVFALAGYLVHDLHETVPFMLLDSLEAIDADRITALIDHFAGYADYLVVALLEEDAQAVSTDYHYITDI